MNMPQLDRRGRQTRWRSVPAAAAVTAVVMATAATAALGQAPPRPPTDAEMLALMKTHCVQCHAAEPTHEAFAKPPAGIMLETIEQVARYAPRIMTQVVVDRAMPLGNQTDMTEAERARVAAWIESRGR